MANSCAETFPEKIRLSLDAPLYTGSVQRLYEVPDHPGLLISETTAGGSVFDVGTIFHIQGSDTGRAGFRHLVFQELQNPGAWKALSGTITGNAQLITLDAEKRIDHLLGDFTRSGAPTHHGGMIDRESGRVFARGYPPSLSNLTLIKKYRAEKPELVRVLGRHFYDYKKFYSLDRYVIPLEYIVRLGVTSGSSILNKYHAMSDTEKNKFLSDIGVREMKPWKRFDSPLVDLSTKYEPEDRYLSRQEAALVSGINGEMFARSFIMAILGAFLLQHIFSKMGLSLWDLKWEIARDGGSLLFVDTIDTDSVRVTTNVSYKNRLYFVHFNKQSMRDYYKIMHAAWYGAVNDAKKVAARSGRPFTEVLSAGQKQKDYPSNPDVDDYFLEIQQKKFALIEDFIRNNEMDLRRQAEAIALAEIAFYESRKKLDEFAALNTA